MVTDKQLHRISNKINNIKENVMMLNSNIISTKIELLDKLDQLTKAHKQKQTHITKLLFWLRLVIVAFLVFNYGKLDHMFIELVGMLLGIN